jgi:pyruvate/2-oxoglutarate dehydrogenase complex dihydrolipoamide dehydrogenase (E3) component
MRPERIDVVVVGAGPAGEVAVGALAPSGLRCALVERELIGGECTNWACIPTKTLLRPAEARHASARVAGVSKPELDWTRIAEYRDWMTRNHDDAKAIADYESQGISVVKGAGRIAGHGRVEVNGRVLETDRVIVATGSTPVIPRVDGLEESGYWTNRQATAMREVPASSVVIGGGPVGIELAQILSRLGARVTIVEIADRLLSREPPEIGELIAKALEEEGIAIHVGRRAVAVEQNGSERVVRFEDGEEVRGEVIVVAGGRRPQVEGIGLETVGVDAGPESIPVDERGRAGAGIWAIGDVTGVALFTHVGKYQARVAAADILGQPAKADYNAVPRVVFSDPEIAAVGFTETQAREQGIDAVGTSVELPNAIARPWTYEERPRGSLGLVADRERQVLVGAWAVSPLASEWIHVAALAIKAEVPLAVLRDMIPQFPSFTEGYWSALQALPA